MRDKVGGAVVETVADGETVRDVVVEDVREGRDGVAAVVMEGEREVEAEPELLDESDGDGVVDVDREGDLDVVEDTVVVTYPLKVGVPLVEKDTVGLKGVGDGDKLRVRVGDTVTEAHREALRVRVRVAVTLPERDTEGLLVGEVDILGERDDVGSVEEESEILGENEVETEGVEDPLGVELLVSLDWEETVLEEMAKRVEV